MNRPPKLVIVALALLVWARFAFSLSFTSSNLKCKAKSRVNLFAAQNQAQERPLVKVYENAFNPSTCEMLHYLAVEHYERTNNDGSSTFIRPPHNKRPLTPLENAIDSALIEMGDKTKLVEYWSRDEYMNIDAHADIDETMLEGKGKVRCPLIGHVLYLEVKDGTKGPTCVFPDEQIGWGQNEENGNNNEKELVIVPAVRGRILRFPGGSMHAVPNPAHRWLLSKEEERALREEEGKCEEDTDVYEEEWLGEDEEIFHDIDWDEDNNDDKDIERSVLLFNTWADKEPGPQGVHGDIATGALPEGIELSEEDAAAFLKSQEEQIFAEWEKEYGKAYEAIRCNPFSEWKSVDIQDIEKARRAGDSASLETVNVSLMGAETRRLYPKQYATLQGCRDQIYAALREVSKVSSVRLQIDD